jgi:cephalosporin hydroxylase
MKLLRPVLVSGDYMIVEDSSINGHPILPSFGPGPFEAVDEYFLQYPEDYRYDTAREAKFGFTFATRGFLIRR